MYFTAINYLEALVRTITLRNVSRFVLNSRQCEMHFNSEVKFIEDFFDMKYEKHITRGKATSDRWSMSMPNPSTIIYTY